MGAKSAQLSLSRSIKVHRFQGFPRGIPNDLHPIDGTPSNLQTNQIRKSSLIADAVLSAATDKGFWKVHQTLGMNGLVAGLPAQSTQRLEICSNRAENSVMRDRFLPKSNSPKDERER